MNFILIPLLAKKELPLERKILLDRILRHQGVEVRLVLTRLGTQNAAQPLGLLLSRTERPGNLDRHRRIG